MPFDTLVANPGRLQILTALAVEPRQEFVSLRQRTRLTDGNLSTHAKRLHTAGFIAIDKAIRDGKPVTSMQLTFAGREALEAHARELIAALKPAEPSAPDQEPLAESPDHADDWVD